MAQNQTLSDEERAELEQLRAEKAAREAAAREAAERAELEQLRAERARAKAAEKAAQEADEASRARDERIAEQRERGRKLMEPDDDLKMPLGQKLVIAFVLVAAVAFVLMTIFG